MTFSCSKFQDINAAHETYDYEDPSYGVDGDDGYEEITQEDCWTVISSFFDQKGLVRQQLDSFDEFVQNTMQELVDENSDLILDQADQHTGHETDMSRRYEIKFGQIYLSRPTTTEGDGAVASIFPQEARLRNLTYSAPLYIEMRKRVLVGREDPDTPGEVAWEAEREDNPDDVSKACLGRVSSLICCDIFGDNIGWYRYQSCCAQLSVFFVDYKTRISTTSMNAPMTPEDILSSTVLRKC